MVMSRNYSLPGFEVARVRSWSRVARVQTCAGDLSDGAVGRHVGEASEPVGQRAVAEACSKGARPAQDRQVILERDESYTRLKASTGRGSLSNSPHQNPASTPVEGMYLSW